MKLIPLTQGKFTKIDDEDFEKINFCKWNFNCGYADGRKCVDGKAKHVKMHRVILGAMDGEYIDHINGDPLDNRKNNLRFCSTKENCRNNHTARSYTGYKGSYFSIKRKKYTSYITNNYKQIYIGIYDTALEAAIAYDKKAIELFGEFAFTNFPKENYESR
jgi:hypothetical protein